ncbi:hypothetical protein [Pilibacter termitis]|uniref:hypothetical protein n=1 Tax=Pilibacter termitis TaxID=263852 RepID=UPI0011871707|nr:hypothetical protein [Pilibacter termitis]
MQAPLYLIDQDIEIKVSGIPTVPNNTTSYDSALNTTLPKGVIYQTGTSTDAKGNALPDLQIVKNPVGTTISS